jgi:ABC-type Mn2+/Zn2+ transport system ATPase subunit
VFNVLEMVDLVVFRRGSPLIKPVSFEIEHGEVVRVTGDNGTGKTTLLETILGLHREWQGTLRLAKIQISYKRQGAPAFESLTLNESWPLIVGATPERRKRLLQSLDLWTLSDQPVGLMSGGEAQRAMLFLAMLRVNELLLLDEPFVGVDDDSKTLISNCLKRDRGQAALLVVEHRPSRDLEVGKEIQLERSPDRGGNL